jgi:excisionase family DNA binding protein
MSKRPWPDNAWPTADELLEWCRTSITSDVTPYLQRLIDIAAERSEPHWVTVEQVATDLDVSKMTVYRWVQEGRLPAAKLGGKTIRIRSTDVDALVQGATR